MFIVTLSSMMNKLPLPGHASTITQNFDQVGDNENEKGT